MESFVWVAPSAVILAIGIALDRAGVLGGFFGTVVIAIVLLMTTLLLAIVRPVWYQDALKRLGIFRSAKPNEMVAAGVGRTFQNIRLFKNMTAVENVLIGMHTRMDATPAGAFFSTPKAAPRGGRLATAAPRSSSTTSASRASATSSRRTSRTATSEGSRSPAPWRPTRGCCCSTSPPRA